MREGNNAGGLPFDRSRAEADRRMRLLEMAGGDLEKAREMEVWVLTGSAEPVTVKAEGDPLGSHGRMQMVAGRPVAVFEPDLTIPFFLDRRRV